MGIDQSKYAWAVHRHTHQNDHCHIRLCRVGSDGVLWNQEHSAKRAIKACAELEVEFDLNKHDRTPAPKDRPSRAEIEISKRKGTPMSREQIQDSVNKILAEHPNGIDFDDFQRLLAELQIEVLPYAPGGILKGVSYSFDSLKWPGSKIGREFSAGLIERGVRYQQVKAAAGQQVSDPFLGQVEQPALPAADKYSRAPASLRSTLREQERGRQDQQLRREMAAVSLVQPKPDQPTKKTWEIDLAQVKRATQDFGPLTQAMALLGSACLKYSLSFLKLLIGWLKTLLAKFGIGVRQAQLASGQQVVGYEPYTLEGETREVTDADAATQLVNQVTTALGSKDAALLPDVDGRDQIAADMLTDRGREPDNNNEAAGHATVNFKAAPETSASEKSELDELFAAESDDRNEPEIDELEALKSAVNAQSQAERTAENTPKLDAPEVVAARKCLAHASQKLRDARAQYQAEKQRKPKLLQFAFPTEKDALSREIAAEATAKAALTDSISRHQPKPPAELILSLATARSRTAQIAKLVADEALKNASLNTDPEVRKLAVSRANSLVAQAELFSKFSTITQANIVLSTAETGQILVAAKRREVADLAALEVHRALQSSALQKLDSDDAPR